MANSIIAAVPFESRMVSLCAATVMKQNLFKARQGMDFLCCSLCLLKETCKQQRPGESFWQFFFLPLSIALGQC